MSDKEEVWVLGNKGVDADKAFHWDEDIPNITDADVVILDLSTLYRVESRRRPINVVMNRELASTAIKIDKRIRKLHAAVIKYLEDKLLGGGRIVYLLHYDEVLNHRHDLGDIIPFGIRMEKVAERFRISHPNHHFKEYLKRVRSINYVLEVSKIPSADTLPSVKLRLTNGSLITDRLEKMIGATFDVIQDENPRGQLTFLPAILPSTSRNMIDMVISELRGEASPPPPWVNKLNIAGVDKIKDKITDRESKKAEIEEEISELESEKRIRLSHSRLLYATGKPLQRAVKAAFVLLGFDEIGQVRTREYEDWRIDFKSVPDVSIGVIEVKGVEKKTGKEDLMECGTWVSDYLLMNPSIKAKGILATNQFRLNTFPESRDKRRQFEPNEVAYAKTRKICIIPTYVLFEAVNKVLAGQSPDRSKIEQLIFDTNGVLESLL